MDAPRQINCVQHGWQAESFVCRHIVESIRSGVPVGFHWPADSDQLHPDAWCSACDVARVEAGGEWNDQLNEILDIQLLCGACYVRAKAIWQRGRKEDQ